VNYKSLINPFIMTTAELVKQAPPSRRKLWLAAIKPPMYTVAVIPIWVGSAIAIAQTKEFHAQNLATFLLSAIAIVAWINVSNDVFDSDTGIDKNKAESVVNLTGNRNLMFWLGNLFLLLGISGVSAICWGQQDWTVIEIVALCCFLGYTYQGPPFRLGYYGVGEIICFACFGPLAVAAAYYSQAQSWSGLNATTGIASIIMGILTSLILFCSHFHQVQDDVAAGKKSPIVRLGTKLGADVAVWSVIGVYVLALGAIAAKVFPPATLGILLGLPIAIQLCNFVRTNHDRPEIIQTCKYLAVRLHFVTGLLLGFGFMWG
jgi:2-carboxy-1,4-naphthoquinone phytyltransferase